MVLVAHAVVAGEPLETTATDQKAVRTWTNVCQDSGVKGWRPVPTCQGLTPVPVPETTYSVHRRPDRVGHVFDTNFLQGTPDGVIL